LSLTYLTDTFVQNYLYDKCGVDAMEDYCDVVIITRETHAVDVYGVTTITKK
jgi:hypothetical protein